MPSMLRRAPVAIAFALAASLAACAVEAERDWQAKLEQQIRGDAFGAARREVTAPPVDDDPAPGDCVEFAIVLEDGEAAKTWRVAVTVDAIVTQEIFDSVRRLSVFEERVQPSEERRRQREEALAAIRARMQDLDSLAIDVRVARVAVEAFDDSGASLGRATSATFAAHLRRGLLDACRAGHRQRDVMRGRVDLGAAAPMLPIDDATHDDVQLAAVGVETCKTLFGILRANPVTRQILREVLELPSLWSLLTNWGVKVTFAVDFFAAERVDPSRFPGEPRELWSVPITLLLNGEPGFIARVIVGPSGSPDGAVAGVFGIVARHPTDEQRRVTVRLVATQRGADAVAR